MSAPATIGRLIFVAAGLFAAGTVGCDSANAHGDESKSASVQDAQKEGQNDAMTPKYSKSGYDITPLSREKVAELAKKLSPEAFAITQSADTERPFCGTLLDNKKEGAYGCVVCGLPLFSSANKFNSGTGWPSFYQEFDREHVARKTDRSHGMARTEINCARCAAHLGHVFDDGPPPTGERYCLNSASLTFYDKGTEPKPEKANGDGQSAASDRRGATGKPAGGAASPSADPPQSQPAAGESRYETAYFAGGCFWGVEHYFQKGPGVVNAVSGYMQGRTDKPTYKDVCNDDTGHAETVKVVFDPSKISYRRLLEAFFVMHDPTQLNYQGPDVGEQYRSGIWTTSEKQRKEALDFIREQQASARFAGRKIVTQVEPASTFFPAEDYHQDYIVKTGRACHVKNPW